MAEEKRQHWNIDETTEMVSVVSTEKARDRLTKRAPADDQDGTGTAHATRPAEPAPEAEISTEELEAMPFRMAPVAGSGDDAGQGGPETAVLSAWGTDAGTLGGAESPTRNTAEIPVLDTDRTAPHDASEAHSPSGAGMGAVPEAATTMLATAGEAVAPGSGTARYPGTGTAVDADAPAAVWPPADRSTLPPPSNDRSAAHPFHRIFGGANGAGLGDLRSRRSLLIAGVCLLLIIAVVAGASLLRSSGTSGPQVAQTAPVGPSEPVTDPSTSPAADGAPVASGPIQSPADINLSPIDQAQVVRSVNQGLRQGSQGKAVEVVQRRLQGLKLLPTAPNGTFGPQTTEAVRRFQRQAQVTGDPEGTVRRATAVALIAAGNRPRLESGNNSEDVRRLQLALALALGRPLEANGNFGPATLQAVKDYQRSRGLPVTGIVADKTWLALQQGR